MVIVKSEVMSHKLIKNVVQDLRNTVSVILVIYVFIKQSKC